MFAIASPTAFEKHGDENLVEIQLEQDHFKFVEWKANDKITIEKFDDYWQEGLTETG